MKEITLHKFKCLRCGHQWYPRKPALPVTCPKCRSAYWDRPVGAKTMPEFRKQLHEARGEAQK